MFLLQFIFFSKYTFKNGDNNEKKTDLDDDLKGLDALVEAPGLLQFVGDTLDGSDVVFLRQAAMFAQVVLALVELLQTMTRPVANLPLHYHYPKRVGYETKNKSFIFFLDGSQKSRFKS